MTWHELKYGRHVAIHATSHVDHEKKIAWVCNVIDAWGSVPIVMVLHLVTIKSTGAQL